MPSQTGPSRAALEWLSTVNIMMFELKLENRVYRVPEISLSREKRDVAKERWGKGEREALFFECKGLHGLSGAQ